MTSQNETPENNTRNFVWIIIGLTTAAACCIACCGVGAWFAAERIGDIPILGDFAQAELPPEIQETDSEKQHWIQSSFSSEARGSELDRRSLEMFFQKVVEACQQEDSAAFQRLVDGDLFWQTIKERGLIKELTRGEDRTSPESFRTALSIPGYFEKFHLQAVSPGRQANHVVAYVYFWEDGWISEQRWWLVRDGRLWKVYDWEPLQTGIRQSQLQAAYAANMPGVSGHEATWDFIIEANAAVDEGEFGKAADLIRKAAAQTVPVGFESEHLVDIAYAWSRCQRSLFVLDVCGSATEQDLKAAPGLLLEWALTAYEAERFEQALELIERYEEAVGGGPNVEQIRSDSLFAMGRNAEAAESYRRLLLYQPEDTTTQATLAKSLPAGQLTVLTDHLRTLDDPAKAAAELSDWVYVSDGPEALLALEKLVGELESGSLRARLLRGRRLAAEGKIDEAGDAFAEVYSDAVAAAGPAFDAWQAANLDSAEPAEVSPEQEEAATIADSARTDFHDLFIEDQRPLDAYLRFPDKQKSFEYFTWIAEDEGLSLEERKAILEKHAETHPNAIAVVAEQASVAYEEGELAKSIDLWRQGLEQSPEEVSTWQLVSALTAEDRLDEAIELAKRYPDDLSLFSAVSTELLTRKRGQEVLALADGLNPVGEYAERTVRKTRAKALATAGQPMDAGKIIGEMYQGAETVWERREACQAWIEIAEAADVPLDRFLDIAGRDSFADLATACSDDRNKRTTLLAAWEARGGDAKSAIDLKTAVLWDQDDYAGIIDLVEGMGGYFSVPVAQASPVLDRYVRSLLRTGGAADASQPAQRLYELDGETTLLIATMLKNGEWEAAEQRVVSLTPYQRQQLYSDLDASELMKSEKATALRRSAPRSGGGLIGQGSAILLLGDSPNPDASRLAEQLQARLPAGMNVAIADGVVPDTKTISGQFWVGHEKETWLVTYGSGSYMKIGYHELKGEELRRAAEKSQGWVSLDLIHPQVGRRDTSRQSLLTLLRHVAANDPLALQLVDDSSYLMLYSPKVLEQLQASFDPAKIEGAETFWLYHPAEGYEQPTKTTRSLRELVEAFSQRDSDETFVVDAAFELPHGRTFHDLPVEGVVQRTYGVDVIVELDEATAQLLGARRGDLCRINNWAIRGWRGER